jgi:TolB protein
MNDPAGMRTNAVIAPRAPAARVHASRYDKFSAFCEEVPVRTMLLGGACAAVIVAALAAQPPAPQTPAAPPAEKHLTNLKALTSGGENAEAYFSFDGTRLIFQSSRPGGTGCDQIYTMKTDGSELRRLSTGTGRTTCGYFYPKGDAVLYATTHLASPDCPPKPSYERGYVWPIYGTYDIVRANPDGTGVKKLTETPGYDAEATIGADGRIVFTSVRDGDMEIYSMNGDGSNVKRLTNRPGPDGGPFFSPDGTQIIFRGHEITERRELDDYQLLLKDALWRPTQLEIFVMNSDGTNLRQLTKMGGANFAPSWHPDGKRIIFASNAHDPRGRDFDLYLVNIDGTGIERVTFNPTFDGFPMFSPDGRKLVFASNRQGKAEGETNVFIADWK